MADLRRVQGNKKKLRQAADSAANLQAFRRSQQLSLQLPASPIANAADASSVQPADPSFSFSMAQTGAVGLPGGSSAGGRSPRSGGGGGGGGGGSGGSSLNRDSMQYKMMALQLGRTNPEPERAPPAAAAEAAAPAGGGSGASSSEISSSEDDDSDSDGGYGGGAPAPAVSNSPIVLSMHPSPSASRALLSDSESERDSDDGGGLEGVPELHQPSGYSQGRSGASRKTSGCASQRRRQARQRSAEAPAASQFADAWGPRSDSSSSSSDSDDSVKKAVKSASKGSAVGLSSMWQAMLSSLPRAASRHQPPPEIKDLPPDRQWERVHKVLTDSSRLSLTRQLRLFLFLAPLGPETRGEKSIALQLLPQIVGLALCVQHARTELQASVDTATKTSPGSYVVTVSLLLVNIALLVFGCQHHRECWPGRLTSAFEGKTWQIMSGSVRERLEPRAKWYKKRFRSWFFGLLLAQALILLWTTASRGDVDFQAVLLRVAVAAYPTMLHTCIAFQCVVECWLMCDRIDSLASSMHSAAFVLTRAEAQAEHDSVRAAAEVMSRRWGPLMHLLAMFSVVSTGAHVQYLYSASEAKLPHVLLHPDALLVLVLTLTLFTQGARVTIHGKRLSQTAAAADQTRIKLTGMLGRTGWASFFEHVPVHFKLPGLSTGVVVDAELVLSVAAVAVAWPLLALCGSIAGK